MGGTMAGVFAKVIRWKFLFVPAAIILVAMGGCNSIAKNHQERLEKIYLVRDRIDAISRELQDMVQIMLHVGRFRDSPLADNALDVAIAIEGEPDELEKKHAQNITADEIEHMKTHAQDLMRQRSSLEITASREKQKIIGEAQSMRALESRYKFFEKLFSNCALGFGIAAAIFIFRRLF
jgi:hypothetical protein